VAQEVTLQYVPRTRLVRISAGTTSMYTEIFRGFPQFLQANGEIVI
jgi:hypothetical protein